MSRMRPVEPLWTLWKKGCPGPGCGGVMRRGGMLGALANDGSGGANISRLKSASEAGRLFLRALPVQPGRNWLLPGGGPQFSCQSG